MEKAPSPEERLEVTTSVHGMPCIQIRNPSVKTREIIQRALRANHIDDPAYKLKNQAGAFLQSDSDDYVLVEFWQKDHQAFVDYLNEALGAF